MTKVCCIDSRSHIVRRISPGVNPFRAPFGVSITINNYEDFTSYYDSVINGLFQSEGLKRKRKIYASSNLKPLFDDPMNYERFLTKLCNQLAMKIDSIGIYYTYFHNQKPDNIVVFREDPPYIRVEREAFLKEIEWSYPHLCAWFYKSNHNNREKIFLDGFGGQLTEAWRLLKGHDLEIIFRGDEVHSGISTADLFIDFIQIQLRKQGKRLFDAEIKQVLAEQFVQNQISVNFLGQKYLKYIAPVSRYSIRTENLIRHPIIFLVKDPEISIKSIEDSEIMDAVCHLASKTESPVKFFETKEQKDQKLVQNGDYILSLDEEGAKMSEKIQKLAKTLGKDVNLLIYSKGKIAPK